MRLITVFSLLLLVMCREVFAQSPTPFAFGWGPHPDIPQLSQAFDKGLWESEGLAPTIVPFTNGRDTFEALIGGQLDIAVMAEFPPVSGALRDLKFSIIAVTSKIAPMRVVAKSGTSITSLKELEGKRIGTPVGTNVHFAVAEALQRQGVTAEIVNVGPFDLIPAMVRGDIDAASMFPSTYQGAKRTLGDEYQEILLPDVHQVFILVASEKVAASNPDLITRFLTVLLKGQELVDSDPEESQEATARYVNGAVTLEEIKASWPIYTFDVRLDDDLLDLMAREGRWVREMGYVKEGDPSPEYFRKWVMPEPLKALAPDRVTIE